MFWGESLLVSVGGAELMLGLCKSETETLIVSEGSAPKTRVSPFCASVFGEDVSLPLSFSGA
jgi:hypothetical protein